MRGRKNNAYGKSETKIGAWRLRDKRLTKAADKADNMKGLQAQMVSREREELITIAITVNFLGEVPSFFYIYLSRREIDVGSANSLFDLT